MNLELLLTGLGKVSLQGGILVVLILLAQKCFSLAPRWRAALWLLVAVRLMLPISWGSSTSIFNFLPKLGKAPVDTAMLEADPPAIPPWLQAKPKSLPPAPIVSKFSPSDVPNFPVNSASTSPSTKSEKAPNSLSKLSWPAILGVAWIIGAIFIAIKLMRSSFQLSRRFRMASSITTPEVLRVLDHCRSQIGLRRTVGLHESSLLATPAVQGVWRPRLLLPAGFADRFSEPELRFVFLHELAHVQRHDLAVNWLVAVLQMVHWFNPLLWWGFARWHADRELACDAAVLEAIGAECKQDYSRTILHLLESQVLHPAAPGVAGILEDRHELKHRITMILGFQRAARRPLLAAAIMLVLGMITLTDARLSTGREAAASNSGKPASNQQMAAAAETAPGNAATSVAKSPAEPIDLLKVYPTSLTEAVLTPGKAKPWTFSETNLYHINRFTFDAGPKLSVRAGSAEIGIGHGDDGAVWAIVIPQGEAKLTREGETQPEAIDHIWLRFHPGQINRLFPPETVSAAVNAGLYSRMKQIANFKFTSSYHAGPNAMIPGPEDYIFDIDTQAGARRFFGVNLAQSKAEYVGAFASRPMPKVAKFSPQEAERAFNQLWQGFDESYAMFALRPEVDWAKQRELYLPKVQGCKSTQEFAEVCAEMLRPLRDLHVWLSVSGVNVPVFNRPRTANANPAAAETILGELKRAGRSLKWAITENQIGYVNIANWSDDSVVAQLDQALEAMRNTRGLIVDVRLNGGGSEPLAAKVAGRFLAMEFVYSYSQYRNGPKHENLTSKYERKVAPRGPWRYDRPVVLLIGQKCMSSNESFVGMMLGDPDLTTMGDHTCGSSGNPKIVELPLEMTVSVPKWIDYRHDGVVLDERGFEPQVRFEAKPGAFEGQRDDLLTAALERLAKADLPSKPIEAPAEHSKTEAVNASNAIESTLKDLGPAPKVVSLFPGDNAQNVEIETVIRIRFDQPMDPRGIQLAWNSGHYFPNGTPHYDPASREFQMPVRLAPGVRHEIQLNEPSESPMKSTEGFKSQTGTLAKCVSWKFETRALSPTPEGATAAARLSPAAGSEIAQLSLLHIEFDQPGDLKASFPFFQSDVVDITGMHSSGLLPISEYDSKLRRLTIPMVLDIDGKNLGKLMGFVADGKACAPLPVNYTATEEGFSPELRERLTAAAKDPRLKQLLSDMKRARQKHNSGRVTVQYGNCGAWNQGGFRSLTTGKALFKWQGENQVYADITDIMRYSQSFKCGSDGEKCWLYSASQDKNILRTIPMAEMDDKLFEIADPFNLQNVSEEIALARGNLAYVEKTELSGKACHLVQGWVSRRGNGNAFASLNQWWIDADTLLPLQASQYDLHSRRDLIFQFEGLNEPLAAKEFQPPTSEVSDDQFLAKDATHNRYFLRISDGSNGRMSGRLGVRGSGGTKSSGLN